MFEKAMVRATPIAALAALLVAASAAFAAPPWSAPESVSSPARFIDDPQVVVDREGRVYAVWRASIRSGVAVRQPGAPEFGPERSAPDFLAPLVPYRAGVLGLDARQGRRPDVISLRARLSRPDGSFGRPDTIATYGVAGGPPSLAAHGLALAAWIQGGPRGRRIVRVAVRRGGRFSRPVTLRSRGRARHVVAAVGQGVMFVAWERAGAVEARVRRVGRGWGPVRRIGPAAKGSTTFRAAFGGRRGYLVWLSQAAESAVLRAAILPTVRTRFRVPQTVDVIERGTPPEQSVPAVVPAAGREAVLAWTDADSAGRRVRAAVTGPGARFGTPVGVSPPGEEAVLGSAAPGTSLAPPITPGAVMVVWSRLDAVGETGDRVRASLLPPGGAFGAPEDVSDGDRARVPDVAYDSIGNRWVAVWSQRIGPDQGVPLDQITTFLRAATRPG